MSLLSNLLDHMPPQAFRERDSLAEAPVSWTPRPAPAVAVAPVSGPYANAANATPEWRQARDQYISHVMTCQGCYAPGGRHCLVGTELRTTYDNTPMEAHP